MRDSNSHSFEQEPKSCVSANSTNEAYVCFYYHLLAIIWFKFSVSFYRNRFLITLQEKCAFRGSNPGPPSYELGALTN